MRGREYQWALLSLLVTACSIGKGINNFADNVTKDEYHGFVEKPTLVSPGDYDRLTIFDWSIAWRTTVVARHRKAATTTIAIRALDGSVACDVPGTEFSFTMPNLDADGTEVDPSGELMVMDYKDGDAVGSMAFYDRNCVRLVDSIAEASWPYGIYGHDRVLIVSGSRLLAVEPRGAGVEVLAERLEQLDTRVVQIPPLRLVLERPTWFIDGGQFAVLDDTGKVTMRYGREVTEAIRLDESNYLIIDGGRLMRVTPTLTTNYATDICGLRDVNNKGYFEYRSPCADGPLRVGAFNGTSLQSAAIDVSADHVFAFDLDFDNPAALFTRPSSDGTSGKEIWFRNKNGESQQLASGVAWLGEHSGPGYPYIGTKADGTLRGQLAAIIDADGTSGRLVGFNPDWNMNVLDGGAGSTNERLLTQAEGVPIPWLVDPYYYQLAHFDGNVGDFIDPFPTGPAIAHGVPADRGAYNTSNKTYTALLADYQSGKGRLGMMPTNNYTTYSVADAGEFLSSNTTRTIRWLADDVAPGTFQFYERMPALAYIDQWDADRGAGRYVVHDISLDTDYILADSVREQFEVLWPSIAVVYAVADGERQGIWIQKAH